MVPRHTVVARMPRFSDRGRFIHNEIFYACTNLTGPTQGPRLPVVPANEASARSS